MKLCVGGLCAALALGWPGSVRAQAAPNEQRSTAYYAGNGALIAALVASGALLTQTIDPKLPGPDADWFPGDCSIRCNYSPQAAHMSDSLLLATVVDPVVASVAQGVNWQLANRGIVYGETLGINFALNSLVKVTVRRPRPYTYLLPKNKGPAPDRYTSFYSGHSAISFAAAISGSYLFAEAAPDRGSRLVLWGSELFLAAMTANLRLRAGKHYYSDVIVGTLVGSGLAIGTLLLHGANYAPEPAEYGVAAGGVVAGTVLAQVLPLSSSCPGPTALLDEVQFAPWSLGREALGVQASGRF